MNCLDIRNICLKIGSYEILKNVSFSIESGSIHALIGDNGAGKTSLLRIILGLTSSYNGEIFADGSNKIDSFRQNIGTVIDSINPDIKSTCAKYLHNICYMLGTENIDFEKELLLKVGLDYNEKKNNWQVFIRNEKEINDSLRSCRQATISRFRRTI